MISFLGALAFLLKDLLKTFIECNTPISFPCLEASREISDKPSDVVLDLLQ